LSVRAASSAGLAATRIRQACLPDSAYARRPGRHPCRPAGTRADPPAPVTRERPAVCCRSRRPFPERTARTR